MQRVNWTRRMTFTSWCGFFSEQLYRWVCVSVDLQPLYPFSPFEMISLSSCQDEFALKLDLFNFLWFSISWVAMNGIPVNMMKSHMSWFHVQRNAGLCTQYLLELCSMFGARCSFKRNKWNWAEKFCYYSLMVLRFWVKNEISASNNHKNFISKNNNNNNNNS